MSCGRVLSKSLRSMNTGSPLSVIVDPPGMITSAFLAERCGMVREGYFRENKKNPDGSFSGTLHYGILSKELDALNYRA